MKAFANKISGQKLTATVMYLNDYQLLKRNKWVTNLECMTEAFSQVAGR